MNTSNTINQNSIIREALIALDGNTHDWQTLFVLDDDGRMVGTLTDGDIRRGLIHGAAIEDKVSKVMHREFRYIREGENDAKWLKTLREQQIFFVPVLDTEGRISRVCDLIKYRNDLPVDVVMMAGGKGERLRPLTDKTPKPLLPLGNKAIIDHNIDQLVLYGIKHINVTVNYLAEQLEKHFSEPRGDVKVQTVHETEFLGTIGAVRLVKKFYNDDILVMNSDLFTNINYEDFYLHFKEQNADMSVAVVPYSVSIPYGIIQQEGRNEIKGIVEKPTYDYYVNAGIYLIKKSVLDYIPKNTMFHSTQLIEKIIEKGLKVISFPLNGTWIDIGNPQEYKRANNLIDHLSKP